MRGRAILTAALALGASGATALAAPAGLGPAVTVRFATPVIAYGERTSYSGRVSDGAGGAGGPQASAIVVETAALPSLGAFTRARTATTGADGRFGLATRPSRSERLRVRAPGLGLVSRPATLYVVPRVTFTNLYHGHGSVTLVYRVRGPRTARLTGKVLLYLGPDRKGEIHLPYLRSGPLSPLGGGVSEMRLHVQLPASYHGYFRAVGCYDAPARSGLDDPRTHCTRKPVRYFE